MSDTMAQFDEEISELKSRMESIKKATVTSARDGFIEELTEFGSEFKKSSDEAKYVSKLLKAFDEQDYDFIKEYVERNYDNYERINNIVKTYDENFDSKEIKRYESKYVVLKKCVLMILEKGI